MFWAGFECASHRRRDGVRLDLIRAAGHDRFAVQDYRCCASLGLTNIRDALRWHLIEVGPGRYDWSSWDRMVEAAEQAAVRVNWDLLHYGFPDHRDPAEPRFVQSFADFALAAAERHRQLVGRPLDHCPVNEASFMSWAIDDGCMLFPTRIAGSTLKRRLAESAIAACRSMDEAGLAGDRIWAEPLIHLAPRSLERSAIRQAEALRSAQFEFLDMIAGRSAPELGGDRSLLGTVGVNFYPHNQWYAPTGSAIPLGHHEHRPLSDMLLEWWKRYDAPLMIAETGAEGSGRVAWLHYISDEVREAAALGVPVRAICLYPITAYPGWDNSRHCEAGLLGAANADGTRPVYQPLLDELKRQRAIFDALQ